METVIPDVSADSSPALAVPPRNSAAYAEWRQTGKLPDAPAPNSEDPAPSTESSAAGDKPADKSAPASEAGKPNQEKAKPSRDNAATRLNELLEDLRTAGLTLAELKTFKRDAQKPPVQQAEPTSSAATEHTAKPAELKPPVKPDPNDPSWKTFAEYEAAKEKYQEDLTDFKVKQAIQADRAERAQAERQTAVNQTIEEAKSRYGAESGATISQTARTISGDEQIAPAVKELLGGSKVMVDVLYTLGAKPEDLAGFVHLARTDPAAAIRKLVVLEQLVTAELAKGGKKPDAGAEGTAQRDSSGRFVKPPENKDSNAPPPAKEVSGRGTPPPDEVERAVKDGDFRAFARSKNEQAMARRRG